MYTVIQAVHSLLYIVVNCYFFSVVTLSGCTCRPFIPVCTGSGSGMQNPLANFIGVFS